jgi:hypothetical protein
VLARQVRVVNLEESAKGRVRRVFLRDGDVLSLPPARMVEILDLLASQFPNLTRVSAYANAHSLMRLSDEELREIRAHGQSLRSSEPGWQASPYGSAPFWALVASIGPWSMPARPVRRSPRSIRSSSGCSPS